MNRRTCWFFLFLLGGYLGTIGGLGAQEEGGDLDFTKGELAAEALTIKAEADKPQVQIIPSRIPPVFKKYQLDERSFVNELLNSATRQQLNKKFKKKTFKVAIPEIE